MNENESQASSTLEASEGVAPRPEPCPEYRRVGPLIEECIKWVHADDDHVFAPAGGTP